MERKKFGGCGFLERERGRKKLWFLEREREREWFGWAIEETEIVIFYCQLSRLFSVGVEMQKTITVY